MLDYGPVMLLQTIGVIIPVIGIIVLMRKGQGKSNSFLVMVNLGALIMNWGYWQFLHSTVFQEAISIAKVQYVGSVIFYVFFILFLNSYFMKGKRSKLLIGVVVLFLLIEMSSLGAVISDSYLAYKDREVQFLEDEGKFFLNQFKALSVDTEDTEYIIQSVDKDNPVERVENGYAYLSEKRGEALLIRYFFLAFILMLSIGLSIWKVTQHKLADERRKLLYITGAEIVVFVSMLLSVSTDWTFDVTPIFASGSTLFIICGTANGNFFTIADRGRGWVLDHSENIFIIVDDEYRFLDANDYAKKRFPMLQGIQPLSALPDEIKHSFMCLDSDFEYGGRKYATKTAPIESRRGVIGYSIMLMDMTSKYNLMEELEAERQKAIAANEAKSNFMSNMSHEIRTPMNAIVGMTEIMLRREQDAFNTEYLNNIKNSGNALLTVVNDILDFSKIESGKMEIIPEEYEIMSVLNDLSMIFLNRIGEKPLELIYDIDPKLPHRLYGDSGRIRQVLLNIVNNGIKYSDEGYVKLTMKLGEAEAGKTMLMCEVTDTGMGIKEEDLDKLFSTFSQVDTKKNRGKEGTGLGLSIAKQLIGAMGGSIQVSSEYGKGSTFTFCMEQGVVDPAPAAHIKSDKDIYITGAMVHSENESMLEKLCSFYEKVHFIDIKDLLEKRVNHVDYIFLDHDTMCLEEIPREYVEIMRSYNAEVIELHNPMMEGTDAEAHTTINKPLYTLNFCQAINHEVLNFQEEQERIMCFTAPNAKALIVDDNEMNRKVAEGLLEPIGMQIDMANDGKQALAKIKENQYDIVFMDHMMPILDGVEATAEVRKLEGEYYQNLPIIALSANALAEARAQFKEAGMNDFLAKPIKTKKLFQMVLEYVSAEKIIRCEDPEHGSVESEECPCEELPVIEGLDVKAGVENSGSLKLFTSLLGDFYKLIDKKTTKIEKCLADGMLRDYTIEVHALKNTARMIGALELSDLFYELEKAGNAEDIDAINALHQRTVELYQSYKPILKPYAYAEEDKKDKIEDKEIVETLQCLKDAMDGFDLDTADAAMKKLEASQMPEAIQERIDDLSAYVADVAMEEVIQLCDALIDELS